MARLAAAPSGSAPVGSGGLPRAVLGGPAPEPQPAPSWPAAASKHPPDVWEEPNCQGKEGPQAGHAPGPFLPSRCSGTSHIPPVPQFPPRCGCQPPRPHRVPCMVILTSGWSRGELLSRDSPHPSQAPNLNKPPMSSPEGDANATGASGAGTRRVPGTTPRATAGRAGKEAWHDLGPNQHNWGTRAPGTRPRPEATCHPVRPWDVPSSSRAPERRLPPHRPRRPCASGTGPPSLPGPLVSRVIINLLTSCTTH